MGKLINRIPGSRLLISSLPGSALRKLVESLSKPRDVNKRSQSLEQAFSKPCLVNLISKDTHLVFSIDTSPEYPSNGFPTSTVQTQKMARS